MASLLYAAPTSSAAPEAAANPERSAPSAPCIPWQSMTAEERAEVLRVIGAAEARAAAPSCSPTAAPAPPPQGLAALRPSASQPSAKLALPSASLTWQNLAFSVDLPGGGKKTVLEPCSGHLEPGQLVAIMGPSGCGKTTLLDMLAMKKTGRYEGQVWVNGHAPDPSAFRRIAAYVGQEDRMPPFWRVREAIEFSARLKLPRGTAQREAVAEMVGVLLEEFGLSEVAGSFIGGPQVRGISGGQRRRVSLARGVAARAPLLFCDEPTSGLSATDAELCVRALQSITRRLNVLALVVIHQPRPEVAALFDTLLLLTSGPGRLVYFGPMGEARTYFRACGHAIPDHANPADAFLDLATPGSERDASAALVAAYAARQRPDVEAQVPLALAGAGQGAADLVQAVQAEDGDGRLLKVPAVSREPYAAPFSTQIKAVVGRKLRTTLRNPLSGALTLVVPCLMGTLLGVVFQNVAALAFLQQVPFFFIVTTGACYQTMGLMAELIDERVYMKYEASEALYAEWVMALGNFCVDVPLALMGSAAQVTIAYLFSRLPWEFFPAVLGWTVLLFLVFDSLFACVAAVAADAQLAQLVATPFLTVFMLFNGFVVSETGAPVWLRWLFQISPNFYAMQSIITTVGRHDEQAEAMIGVLGYSAGREAKAAAVMLSSVAACRMVQVLALKYLNNIQR